MTRWEEEEEEEEEEEKQQQQPSWTAAAAPPPVPFSRLNAAHCRVVAAVAVRLQCWGREGGRWLHCQKQQGWHGLF